MDEWSPPLLYFLVDIQCHSAILHIMEVIFIVNHVVFNTKLIYELLQLF